MTFAADGLEITKIVCSTLGSCKYVVALGSGSRPTLSRAGLAKPIVSIHYLLSEL